MLGHIVDTIQPLGGQSVLVEKGFSSQNKSMKRSARFQSGLKELASLITTIPVGDSEGLSFSEVA